MVLIVVLLLASCALAAAFNVLTKNNVNSCDKILTDGVIRRFNANFDKNNEVHGPSLAGGISIAIDRNFCSRMLKVTRKDPSYKQRCKVITIILDCLVLNLPITSMLIGIEIKCSTRSRVMV